MISTQFPNSQESKIKNFCKIKREYVSCVAKKELRKNITSNQNGAGGDDVEENLIEVCRICHTKIHNGEITIEIDLG